MMWDRLARLATVSLACVWLAVLSGCDAMKSEGQTRREYRRVLVGELCAPGEFYSECVWTSARLCHEQMDFWVANCIPFELERVQPSTALRESVLECVFDRHFLFTVPLLEETEECLDATRWKHILPGQKHELGEYQQRREESRKQQANPQSVPEPTDTPPEPSPGAAPEPSSGILPDQASAP